MTAVLLRRSGVRYQDWRDRSACRGEDPELFFPREHASPAAAQAVCWLCPVTADCLAHALSHPEQAGVWGGLSEEELRRLRREQAVPVLRMCGKDGRGPHLMDAANTYINPSTGQKRCLACLQARQREYDQVRRAAAVFALRDEPAADPDLQPQKAAA